MSWGEDEARCRQVPNLLGLIGQPLTHSFSKRYFNERFAKAGMQADWYYELFPLREISELPDLLERYPNLRGLNVTIPYKNKVLSYVKQFGDEQTRTIGAVNTILPTVGGLLGYNTDYVGFRESLINWWQGDFPQGALILGAGGAAQAVAAALTDLNVAFLVVNRSWTEEKLGRFLPYGKFMGARTFAELSRKEVQTHYLIINCTPLGTAPRTEECPDLDYSVIGGEHGLYDLVYNPEKTLFLQSGAERGAATKNGYDMLVRQAEAAWRIWTRA